MVRKELCYYGPQDLMSDYNKYGNHRFSFVSEIFPRRYLTLAHKLTSDTTSQKEKKELMESKLYRTMMSMPAGAYTRKKFNSPPEHTTWYVTSEHILNREEIKSFVEEVEAGSDDEFYSDQPVYENTVRPVEVDTQK